MSGVWEMPIINIEDKYTLMRELKDLASELKSVRNSVLILNNTVNVVDKA